MSTSGRCFCFGSIPSFFSGVISPLISSSILSTYQPGEFIFQCPTFLPFHTVHGVLKARILKWFAIPFSREPHSVRLSTVTHPSWVALYSMAHSFTELEQAVVHVIRLVNFLWFWFSVCLPLMKKDKRLMEASWWIYAFKHLPIIYWVSQTVHLGSSVSSCGKAQMKFLDHSMYIAA